VRELNFFTSNLKKRQIWEKQMNDLIEKAPISEENFIKAINKLQEAYHKDPADPLVEKYFSIFRKYIWPQSMINNYDALVEANLKRVPANIQDGDDMLEGLKANYHKFKSAFSTMVNQNPPVSTVPENKHNR
jgi:hypothetical protein